VEFQYQHHFGNFFINKIANSHAVAHQQVVLQLFWCLPCLSAKYKVAQTGIDAVNHFLLMDNFEYHITIGLYTGDGFRSENASNIVAGKLQCRANGKKIFAVAKSVVFIVVFHSVSAI
jgi:hypothetical protein